jgi:hypothetical protein
MLHCKVCDATVGFVYGVNDGVVLTGQERTTKAVEDSAKRTGVGKRRHRRETWSGSEFLLRGEGYAKRDPEAWCPDDRRMALPNRDRLLADFDKAVGERRTVHVRVPPIG